MVLHACALLHVSELISGAFACVIIEYPGAHVLYYTCQILLLVVAWRGDETASREGGLFIYLCLVGECEGGDG